MVSGKPEATHSGIRGSHKTLAWYMNIIAANGMNQTLVKEIQRRKNQRTMPMTWAQNKHPGTMYYRQF